MDGYQNDNRWHLDKRVPIALIFVVLGQFGFGAWFASRMAERQEQHERRIAAIEQQNISGRMATLESQVSDVKEGVRRIDGNLQRLIDGRILRP